MDEIQARSPDEVGTPSPSEASGAADGKDDEIGEPAPPKKDPAKASEIGR